VPWGIIYELDPVDGTVIKEFNFPGPQAWGMTYDGENLWVNDFAERKVYEVDIDGNVLSSFQIPDETGGAKGITWDGENLYIMGWANPVIYKVNKQGEHLDTINASEFGGGLTWDGEYFWAPGGKGIAKINKDGQMIGSIYAASEGTWDLTWDGEYLWATQRTNENWFDSKIYQIEIIDAS
jgi:glutamine cyclotransferase